MIVENKKAKFDYEIIEPFEAGIALSGSEVKSVRAGGANFTGSRVFIKEDGAFVLGLSIQKYKFDSSETYDPLKTRRLLLHKKELISMQTKMRSSSLTLVPVKLYNKGSLVKVQIALVRGKKKFEKREVMKKRDTDLGLARRLKTNR